jgi:hypothetical protein
MADESTSATDKLEQVRGVTWDWRDDAPDDAKDQLGMGVVAQELEQVFPELVTTDELGRKKVNYLGLIGPLIEAVKELDARVAQLETELGRKASSP